MFPDAFASKLTRDCVDLVTVKELPAHADIKTTLRYAHCNDETTRGEQASEQVGRQ
jgi:site-specific recombinase XerD